MLNQVFWLNLILMCQNNGLLRYLMCWNQTDFYRQDAKTQKK